MNGGVASAPTSSSPSRSLASASIVAWLAATVLAGPLGVWPAIGGAAVALGLAVLLLDRPASTALLQPSPRLVLLGTAAGGMMAAATYLLFPLVVPSVPRLAPDLARLYAAFRAPSPVVAAMALLPVVIGEELVWRGVVQASLVRRMGTWRGVAVAAVVYALVHAPLGSPVLVAVALYCGLAWGAMRATTASLVPTLVAHLLWDALVLLWLPLDSR